MRRWTHRTILCLVLGVITTLAVAWACAWWVPLRLAHRSDIGTPTTDDRTWHLVIYERSGARWIEARAVWDIDLFRKGRYTRISTQVPRRVMGPSALLNAPPDPELPFELTHVVSSRGWPLLALMGERTFPDGRPAIPPPTPNAPPAGGPTGMFTNRLAPQSRVVDKPRLLPLRPLWPGLIGNTALYGGLWALGFYVMIPIWRFMGRRGLAAVAGVTATLAAATTIAIAWLCAWNVDVHEQRFAMERRERRTADGGGTIETMFETMGAQRLYLVEVPGTSTPGRRRGTAGTTMKVEDRRGWPWLAMESTLYGTTVGRGRQQLDRIAGGLRLRSAERDLDPTSLERVAALPLRPAWDGFAADWALFGSAWWVLLTISVVPRWSRSLSWRRRGRCPWCGYLLTDDQETCPECGRGRD